MHAGCSADSNVVKNYSKNYACAYNLDVSVGAKHCVGMSDVDYYYGNHVVDKNNSKNYSHIQPAFSGNENYIVQDNPNHCYAASLSMAFKVLGYNYDQERFAKAISDTCIAKKNVPLTFSQIVYAATKVHLESGGIWYVSTPNDSLIMPIEQNSDKNKTNISINIPINKERVCISSDGMANDITSGGEIFIGKRRKIDDSSFLAGNYTIFNPYRMVAWVGKFDGLRGGVIPIKDTNNLVCYFTNNVPLLAGMVSDDNGHVVIIRSISYSSQKTTGTYIHLDQVEIIDPNPDLRNDPLIKYTGDDFLAKSRFIFAIYNGSKFSLEEKCK